MPSVADYIIRLSVDGTKASVGLASVSRQIDMLGGRLKTFALSYLGTSSLMAIMDRAFDLSKTAQRIGVTTEALQEMEYAAKRTGASLADIEKAFAGLREGQFEALRNPTGEKAMNFAQLGIGASDLQSSTTDALFTRIAEAVRKSNGAIAQTVPAMKLMRQEGDALAVAFVNGFASARSEAQNLGMVIKEDVVSQLALASGELKKMGTSLTVSIAHPLAAITKILGGVLVGTKAIVYGANDSLSYLVDKLSPFRPSGAKERDEARYMRHQAELAMDWRNFFMDPGVELDPAKRRPVGEVESREAVKSEKVKAANYRRNDVDSLAKVGTYIGVAQYSAPMLDVLRNQLRAQLEIARNTRNRSGAATSEW